MLQSILCTCSYFHIRDVFLLFLRYVQRCIPSFTEIGFCDVINLHSGLRLIAKYLSCRCIKIYVIWKYIISITAAFHACCDFLKKLSETHDHSPIQLLTVDQILLFPSLHVIHELPVLRLAPSHFCEDKFTNWKALWNWAVLPFYWWNDYNIHKNENSLMSWPWPITVWGTNRDRNFLTLLI